jgi:hypothetical protein
VIYRPKQLVFTYDLAFLQEGCQAEEREELKVKSEEWADPDHRTEGAGEHELLAFSAALHFSFFPLNS